MTLIKVLTVILIVIAVLIILYLLAIMPHMIGRADITPFLGRFYAHRGLFNNKSEAPENSMAAFRKAVEAGYGIEFDIHLSKDGEAVVMHDANMKRACKVDDLITNYTVAELKEKFRLFNSDEQIPTLREVLELVDGKVPLIIEFKGETTNVDLCEKTVDLLDAYKGVWCMESFNPVMVRWYRTHRPNRMRGQLSMNYVKDEGVKHTVMDYAFQNLIFNFLTKPDFIAFDHNEMNMFTFSLIRKLYHPYTFAWTIKNQDELENAKKKFDFMIFDSFIPQGKPFEGKKHRA